MSLASGTKLGPYEILSPIGAGGMGEVYRARDPRLGRDVAIKVLPASYSEDADRLRRFEQEARAAGLLNHPNITAVYDIGSTDGAPYVVQELLEGETLRAILAGGKLAPRRAVDYAIAIARGLAAAHEKGIVHRDLKPENLFVTNDGSVKILDFGLAKLVESDTRDGQTNLPTASPATEPGVVLGTLGYMSPEQVRGRPADHRSDIFSFGAILYEMLAGRRAFQGDSAADTLSAILKEDPPELSVTNQPVPPALERIIRHCLEKSPERRAHSAHDLAFELESLTQTSGTAPAPPGLGRRFSASRVALSAVAILALAAAYLLGRRATPARSVDTAPRTYHQITSFSGAEVSPSLSPDGQAVAFTRLVDNKPHVWIQRTGGQIATDLTPDCADGSVWPAFSPDGNTIAYASRCGGGGIFLVGASGESARRLTSVGDNPAWSPDGKEIVFSTESDWRPFDRTTVSEIWAAEVSTGKTRKLFAGDAVQPAVSPHQLRIAYWGLPASGSHRDIWTIPYGGLGPNDKPVAVTQDAAIDWNPVWTSDGRFLYFLSDRSGSMNLWRVAIDEKSGTALGPPEPRMLPALVVGGFAISGDGRRLAYVAADSTYSIERVLVDAATGETKSRSSEILRTTMSINTARPSPDGTLVAFDSMGAVQEDIFLVQSDGSKLRHLTDDAARDRFPWFFPDGKRILFQSDRGGNWDLWSIAPDGSGLTQLTRSSNSALDGIPSPDGRRIVATNGEDMLMFELDDHGGLARERKLPRPEGLVIPGNGGWAPDGRSVFVSNFKGNLSVTGLHRYFLDTNRWESLPAVADLAGFALAVGEDRLIALTREGVVWRRWSGGPTRMLAANPKDGRFLSHGVTPGGGDTLILVRDENNADIWMATPP